MRARSAFQLASGVITIGVIISAATPSSAGVLRSNYYHGSMCQGPTPNQVLYAANGIRANFTPTPQLPFIGLVCPAPWSVDTPTGGQTPPLRNFQFEVYYTNNSFPAPLCSVVINTTTNGLTLIGSPRTSVDQTTPTTNTASSNTQSFPTGLVNDVRRAYMQCTGISNTGGIDGYTMSTCVGSTIDCGQN